MKGRVTFTPLVDHFPCFSALQLSIVETPHLDFAAKLGGSDLLALPLVQPTVERMLQVSCAGDSFIPGCDQSCLLGRRLSSSLYPLEV